MNTQPSGDQDNTYPATDLSMTAAQLAELVGGELIGAGDLAIDGINDYQQAGPTEATLLGHPKYTQAWSETAAQVTLIQSKIDLPKHATQPEHVFIRVADADLASSKVLEYLTPAMPQPEVGVHPSAVVDPSAELGQGVSIGPNCTVGPNAKLSDGVILQANVTVMDDVQIGAGTILWPGVVIRERCIVGRACILHPNVTIGADGFGYRPDPATGGIAKIPQIGIVEIGDAVEIGAGTTIDRAKFKRNATRIGSGTKIDNLCQIGHNCDIGRCVIIAGCAGIAGSVTIGDGAILGGNAGVADHINIGAGVKLGLRSLVDRDIPAGETWVGYPALPGREGLMQLTTLRRLGRLGRYFKKIEKEGS